MLTRPLKEQNQLFHSIPLAEWEGLLPHIELVPLPLGKIISEPDTKIAFVYFPVTAIVSILHELANTFSIMSATFIFIKIFCIKMYK